jgi:hypothetical protein
MRELYAEFPNAITRCQMRRKANISCDTLLQHSLGVLTGCAMQSREHILTLSIWMSPRPGPVFSKAICGVTICSEVKGRPSDLQTSSLTVQ